MRILKSIEQDFWWDVAAKCEYATFFHTPLWHRLAASSSQIYSDATIGAELDDGRRAVFPLLKIESGYKDRLFERMVSTYSGCYGGPIADRSIHSRELLEFVLSVARNRSGHLRITSNPLAPDNPRLPGFNCRTDSTHILDLSLGHEQLFSNYSKGHRYNARKGRSKGVRVRTATTFRDYEDYYEVYRSSMARWGEQLTREYPWRLFSEGARLAEQHGQYLKLWLAIVEDQIAAGAWVFYWNSHAVYWHGATNSDYFEYYPVNVLLDHVIREASLAGYSYFDFNPSGGHEGVRLFKARFGADEVPVNRYHYSGRAYRLVNHASMLVKQWANRSSPIEDWKHRSGLGQRTKT